jgi:GxxExxY protein
MFLATDGAQMNPDEEEINALTEMIIGLAFRVGSVLGCGFMEKCYENALACELSKAGLRVRQQIPINVWYDDVVVGEYVADLIVENVVMVELTAIAHLETIHSAQCINYLTATKLPVCLLISFSKRVEVKRLVGSNFPSSSVSIGAPSVAKILPLPK